MFGGGTDEDYSTVLNEGQEIVLLAFIKPVYLVYEEYGTLTIASEVFLCFLNHFLHILFAGGSSIYLLKIRPGGRCYHFGQSGLSRTGRTVKYNGAYAVGLYGTV